MVIVYNSFFSDVIMVFFAPFYGNQYTYFSQPMYKEIYIIFQKIANIYYPMIACLVS